jgi:hypothetical protein
MSLYLADWIFVGGSGMLGISIGLNAVSTHGACTAIFVLVAAIAGFLCGSIQTLGRISWLAWIGLISIVTASESFHSCFLFLVIPSNDISSLDFDDRCWRAGPSRRCSPGRTLVFRLRTVQEPELYGGYICNIVSGLCVRRHSSILLHSSRDAGPSPLH